MAFTLPIWEVQTGGSDANNGGGFDTGVAGFPTDGAATSATGSTPLFSSSSYTFVNGDIGHWIFIKSGTNWTPGWYKITAVTASPNSCTLDAAVGHCPLYDSNANPGKIKGLNTTAGCATTGSPTSATWGIDYSQGSKRFTSTHFSTDATNTHLLDADNTIGKNWVGNIVVITAAGTGFTLQRVAIASTSGTTATCDKTLGGTNLSGGGGGLGGPLASLGQACASNLQISNGATWVGTGSYTVSSASTGVAGGCYTSAVSQRVEGYGTYRGDMATAPVFTAGSITTFTFMAVTAGQGCWRNITFDGNSTTSSRGFNSGVAFHYCERLIAKNCKNNGFIGINNEMMFNCVATGCATASAFASASESVLRIACVAYSNSVIGFDKSSGSFARYLFCLSTNNSGGSSVGFNLGLQNLCINCTSYGNGSDGFVSVGATGGNWFFTCVAENNGGWGFNNTGGVSATTSQIVYCATQGNTSGDIGTTNPPEIQDHNIVYTQSAMQKASQDNYVLNTRDRGGALLRGFGWPGAFANGSSTGYLDVGAVQAPFPVAGVSPGGGFLF